MSERVGPDGSDDPDRPHRGKRGSGWYVRRLRSVAGKKSTKSGSPAGTIESDSRRSNLIGWCAVPRIREASVPPAQLCVGLQHRGPRGPASARRRRGHWHRARAGGLRALLTAHVVRLGYNMARTANGHFDSPIRARAGHGAALHPDQGKPSRHRQRNAAGSNVL